MREKIDKKKGRPRINISLPEWFDLNQYQHASYLNVTGWYEQLLIRYRLKQVMDVGIDKLPAWMLTSLKLALSVVRDQPVIDTDRCDPALLKFCFSCNPEYDPIEQIKKASIDGIRCVTIEELCSIVYRLDKTKRDHICNDFEERQQNLGKGFYQPQYPREGWYYQSASTILNDPVEILHIDLSKPDKLLLLQFKKFLSEKRSGVINGLSNDKFRRDFDIKDLITFAILPYLDLQLWAQENNMKLNNSVIAEAIFPSGERGQDYIKTTIKLAKHLLDWGNLCAFANRACLDEGVSL